VLFDQAKVYADGTASDTRFHVTAPCRWVHGRARVRYVGTYRCPRGHIHLVQLREPVVVVQRRTACGLRIVVHIVLEAGSVAA